MVKHIIIWNLKESFTDAEKAEHKAHVKEGLESLQGKIDGLIDIRVYTDLLDSGNGDLVLMSTFADEASLKGYQVHPAHVKVATEIVRPVVACRKCVDFVE